MLQPTNILKKGSCSQNLELTYAAYTHHGLINHTTRKLLYNISSQYSRLTNKAGYDGMYKVHDHSVMSWEFMTTLQTRVTTKKKKADMN
jgi:hypothetical protein